jgi:hypothetical protein
MSHLKDLRLESAHFRELSSAHLEGLDNLGKSSKTMLHIKIVMSKTKGQTFRYRFGNETKMFWYRSRVCLVVNRLFRFGPESGPNTVDMISFEGEIQE